MIHSKNYRKRGLSLVEIIIVIAILGILIAVSSQSSLFQANNKQRYFQTTQEFEDLFITARNNAFTKKMCETPSGNFQAYFWRVSFFSDQMGLECVYEDATGQLLTIKDYEQGNIAIPEVDTHFEIHEGKNTPKALSISTDASATSFHIDFSTEEFFTKIEDGVSEKESQFNFGYKEKSTSKQYLHEASYCFSRISGFLEKSACSW